MADEGLDRIEVQLGWMSGQDSQAFDAMKSAVQESAKLMAQFSASDFVDAATKLKELHAEMVEQTRQLRDDKFHAQTQIAQPGGAISPTGVILPPGNASTAQREKTVAEQQQRDEDLKEYQKEQAAHNESLKLPTQQGAMAAQTDAALKATAAQAAQAASEAEEPPSRSRVDKAIDMATKIPFLGPTIDQTRKEFKEKPIETVAFAPQAIQSAAAAPIGIARFLGATPFTSTAAAASLGYDPSGSQVGLGPLPGITLPFGSEASREGLRQQWTAEGLRWQAGLNRQQVGQIMGAQNMSGFGGTLGQRYSREVLAPFTRAGGDPSQLIPFSQAMRTGTATVDQLAQTVSKLRDAARTANIDVNTFTSSVVQFAEQMQQRGGSFNKSANLGIQFTQQYGLDPSVLGGALQSPLVQAMMGARGIPTSVQGAADPSIQLQAFQQASRFAQGATAGVLGPQTIRFKSASGKEYTRQQSASDYNDAMAAQLMHMSVDQYKSTRASLEHADKRQAFGNMFEQYAGSTGKGGALWKEVAGRMPGASDAQITKEVHRRTKTDYFKANSNDSTVRFEDLAAQAQSLGVDSKTLGKIRAIQDPGQQREKLMQAVNAKDKEAQDKKAEYAIAFTGQAEAFFKAVIKNDTKGMRDASKEMIVGAVKHQNPSAISDQSAAASTLNTNH